MDLVSGCLEKRNQLEKFYNALSFEILPGEVRDTAIKCLLDVIACAVGGSNTESSKIVYDFCKNNFPGKDSQIWSDGNRLSPIGASFVNATMASDLDIDDGNRSALGHPGSTIIPPLLAIGQQIDCTLKDIIVATVLGYDIGVRFGEVLLDVTDDRFYGTGTWATVGAAAAVAKVLRVSSDVFLNSIGIAEAYAPLSPVMKSIQNGSNTKEAIGWGSFNSIIAVELAKKGFLGVESMLYHKGENRNPSVLADLGKEFRITKTYFKQYSACRWAHAPIEGVMRIKASNFFSPKEVTKITVKTHEKALSLKTVTPKNAIQAEYSIPFTVASVLLFGEMGPEQLTQNCLSSRKVLDLSNKVEMLHSEKCQALFPKKSTAILEIDLSDGRKLSSGIVSPKGDFDDPLTKADIDKKFGMLIGNIWNEKKKEKILATIKGKVEEQKFGIKNLFSF